MKRHAKASTAGSTMRRAKGLGRIFRGAVATRGASLDAKGSGAPSSRRLLLPVGLFAAILATGALLTALAGAATPAVITGTATNVTTSAATLNGTVNPEGEELSECFFQYGPTTAYGSTAPCAESAATIGAGTSPVAVHADISGLDMASVYHFRLKAVNPSGTAQGADQTLQTLGPVIKGTWSENVVFTEATLRAEINPAGKATTYHFEWGTDTSYGNSSPEASVGSDSADHKVGFFLEGLQPGTTYHYRVVATNSDAVNEGADHSFTTYAPSLPQTNCPNQAFRVGASANLPDCRAYEMVSPLDKGGGDIIALGSFSEAHASWGGRAALNRAAVGGGKLTYSTSTSFGDQPSSRYTNQYISSRGPSGWSTHGINAPLGASIFDKQFQFPPLDLASNFKAMTEDLSSGWILDQNEAPLTPNGQAGFVNLYRRDNLNDTYEALTVTTPTNFAATHLRLEFKGYSDDLSHQVFNAGAALTPDAASNTNRQVYDYTNGGLELVSILPNGEADPQDSIVGAGQNFSNNIAYRQDNVDRAVSADGSRIFWTSGTETSNGRIYVRIDGQATVPVSGPGDPIPKFQTASTDGSKVMYSVFVGGGKEPSLYEFDVDSETRSLIAEEVRGVVGASEDLSHIYFASQEVLAPGATVGKANLYLDHEGTKTFIATLSDEAGGGGVAGGSVALRPIERRSRVTPDGQNIVFMSDQRLTGYDNTDALTGEADLEVFHYDADGEQLTCVSCNPAGARPVGSVLRQPFAAVTAIGPGSFTTFRAAAWIPSWEAETIASRVLSEDGNRLFFNSFDALLPHDTNGVQDVYQWEAQGFGSCQEPGGCLSLISTGQSPQRSEFIDASADGSEVFLETESSIDPRDPGLIDLYVAKVGGGYPPPPEPTPCVGDACQSIPAAPADPTPASASFKGAGDPRPRRSCAATAKRAAKLSRQAKQLRRKAKRASSAEQGRRLSRRSAHSAKQAKRLSKTATRCRRANRRAAR